VVLESSFSVKPLDQASWRNFASLVEKQNGVWGGCWCMAFHPEGVGRGRAAALSREGVSSAGGPRSKTSSPSPE